MENPGTMAFGIFSHRAVSSYQKGARTIRQRLKQWTASGTARTSLSTKLSKRQGLSLTRGALNSSINSVREFKIAVVTSSQNCTAVLQAAKLDHFFDVQVDGN